MIESDATRAVFLADFGDHITIAGQKILGIYDAEYQPVDASGLVASSAQPAIWIRTADAVALDIKRTDLVEVNDVTHVVYEHQPDGTGISVVLLHKQP